MASSSWAFNDSNVCMNQVLVNTYSSDQGPPFIEEDLKRSPQCHPANDSQSFSGNADRSADSDLSDGLGHEQAHREKSKSDQQAGPAFLQEPLQLSPHKAGFVIEVIMNGLGHQLSCITFSGRLFDMNRVVDVPH